MAKTCIYISVANLEEQIGVAKKIEMQCAAIEEIGFKVIHLGAEKPKKMEIFQKLLPFYYGENCKRIKEHLISFKNEDVRIIYIRHSPSAIYGMLDIMATAKEVFPKVKIILEFPTFPYDAECSTLKSKPMLYRDRLHRGKLKKYVDYAATLSPDKDIYGIPAIEITNGTSVDSFKPHANINYEKDTLNLIAVAGISKWHALDRVIEGIAEYYQKKRQVRVLFHVIGEGPYRKSLEERAKALDILDYIYFYGKKSGRELEDLYNKSDIAVGSLGLHRVYDYPHVSVLKTREYCAIGIPFITIPQDYVFAESGFPFSMIVPADDTAIDIQKVVDFNKALKKQYTDSDITQSMRKFAKENLEWSAIFSRLFNEVGVLEL